MNNIFKQYVKKLESNGFYIHIVNHIQMRRLKKKIQRTSQIPFDTKALNRGCSHGKGL